MAQANNYKNVGCPAYPSSSSYYYIIEVEVREESTDVTNNKSRLYLEADITGHEISFSGSDTQYLEVYWWDSKNGEILGATTTLTSLSKNATKQVTGYIDVPHNDDGTLSGKAYTIWGKNGSNSYVPPATGDSVTVEAPLTLTTINRKATINTFTGTEVEGAFSATYTKYVNNWTYKLRVAIPNVATLETITYNTSGATFYLSNASKNTIYSQAGNATSINLEAVIETWNGSTKIGESSKKTLSVAINRTIRVKVNGAWKRGVPYVKINGTWKRGIPYIKVNGTWKRGI